MNIFSILLLVSGQMKIIKTYKDLKICESEIMDLSISVFFLHLYLISVYDLKILETPNPWVMETLLHATALHTWKIVNSLSRAFYVIHLCWLGAGQLSRPTPI
jgi:hypothetical protein